jgi:microsomal dipeptidase-like Zn-dependent dipeptidase
VALRAICSNPANLSDDVLRALIAKGGIIGIHSAAEQIGQRYYDWSRGKPSIPVNGVTREQILFGELSLIRSPNQDYGEYIDALDAQQGGRWRRFYSQPWHESPEGEALVPSLDDWVAHVAHAVAIGGQKSVAIGLDLTNARSTLKNFDASHYPELVEALRKHNLATPEIFGENWLRVLDSAKVPN